MILIIDGDFIAYQVGFALAKNEEATLDDMKSRVDFIVSSLLRKTNAIGYIAYIGGKGNYRYEVAKEANKVANVIEYKNNRPARPHFYKEVRQYLVDTYDFHVVDGMEADDACGITLNELASDACLLSQDKDLLQVPGTHLQLKKTGSIERVEASFEGELYLKIHVTPSGKKRTKLIGNGTKFLWAQMLMGDMVDSIRGIPRCGPVKAHSILKDVDLEDMPTVVWKEYVKAYGDDAEVFFNTYFDMLFVLRVKDDFVIPQITVLNFRQNDFEF